jgi:hypothetical protein
VIIASQAVHPYQCLSTAAGQASHAHARVCGFVLASHRLDSSLDSSAPDLGSQRATLCTRRPRCDDPVEMYSQRRCSLSPTA